MGGKTGTTTSSVAIPPEVLARYNSVNAQAQNTAGTPFQQYSTDPSAFVAPLNQEQNAGISGINTYANAAQPGYQAGMNTTGSAINQINAGQNVANPYYGAATGLTGAAAAQTAMNANAAQPAYQAGYGAANNAQDVINAGQNVAQPYFQGAQTMAAGTVPQYQQASGLANAAMTPLQQATYAAQPGYQAAQAGTMAAGAGTGQTIGQIGNISQGYNAPNYQAGVAGYMNPFLQNAMGSTAAMMQNQNRQQQNQLQGNAISSGAFGGDRGNIAQAALMGQQNLAMGQTLGQMANTGYQSAAQNYMSGLGQQGALAGQQGAMYGQLGNLANQYGQLGGQSQQALINAGQAQQQGAANIANIAGQGMNAAGQYGQLGAAAQNAALQGAGLNQQQANLYGQLGTGAQNAAMQGAQQLGALGAQYGQLGTAAQNAALQGVPMSLAAGAQQGQLGAGAQAAGLQGAQAQVGAGTLGQQTTQAGQTALYNQFQQQQAYPFQVSQFLANIAEGTGALSGSTTTTQAPQSFFSDVRLKEDIKRVGTAKNGLPIYTFKYKGDDTEQTHTGYMAQDVEKVHPEAVGESHGYKTVDYDKASEPVHKYAGGVVANSEGGVVAPEHSREGYFDGGDVINPNDLSALIAQQQQSYAPFQQAGIYGGQSGGTPHGGAAGVVPAANLHVSHLAVANPARTQQGDTLMGDVQQVENIGDRIKKANDYRKDIVGHAAVPAQPAVPASYGVAAKDAVPAQDATGYEWLKQYLPQGQAHGGVVGYASGGGVEPYQTDDPMSQIVSDTEKDKNKHGLMTAQNPTGQPSSTLGDLGKIASLAALPGEIASGAGAAASGIGSLMAMLAPIGLASGGVVPREHHAGPDDTNGQSNVVGNGDQTPNYEALAQATAQKYGLNPKDFGSVIKGESGFNPKAIGDEGSSAGLGQFHIAGASEKYPHAGLGDDYISARNPELAKSGTAQDKIAYLSDPANAPDQLDFMGQHVAKNGYGAWTAAKNLGLADLPAKNAVPAQAVVNGQQGFQTPDSETPKKSLGDTLMSEQFLVPLLSGLGTMAGSNSRYLGAAILQGIGGGAKAYEDVQNNLMQRQLDQPIAQSRNIAVANQLQSGLVEYNATRSAAGLPPVSLQEYARISGYKGALPEGVQDTSSNQPSGQGFNYSIPEMNSLNINRNGVNIPAMNDQGYLRTFIAKNAGIQSPYMKSAVESAQHNLDLIVANQRTQNAAGETINAPGAIGTGQQTALASQRMASSGEFVNQAIAFNKIAPNIKQNLSDLEDIYSQFRSGASGPARQSFQQLMGAIDPQGNYPSLHDADASNYQSALKGAASLMTAQLANMPAGAPKSELEALQRQIANPNMEPAAVHHIISRAKAAVDYQDKMNMGYNPEENNYDVLGYQRKFKSTPENDYEKLVNTTEENMKPGAGTSGTITPETGKIYQDANGNKARWDGSKYIKVQ